MPSKNFEYPVEPGLEPSEIVKAFGDAQGRHAAAGRHRQEPQGRSEMVDRVGLDDGPSS